MSRLWTARKESTLITAAIDPSFAAYPVFRAGPERGEATKQALRLLAGFVIVGVPAHCGVCLLAAHSLGLAAVAVLFTAAALLTIAFARWLGLEELLQRLPLLLVLGLAGVALVYFTSLPSPQELGGSGGFGLIGGLLLFVVAMSILGSLYRPLAAAYQSVTLRVPFRDLCVAAVGLLVSLGFAALGQTTPKQLLLFLNWPLSAFFAGLVVVEYAAWARSNPSCDLYRLMAFDRPRWKNQPPRSAPQKPVSPFAIGPAVLAAVLHGICFGLVTDAVINGFGPASGLHRLYPPTATGNPEATAALLNLLQYGSFIGIPLGLLALNRAMNAAWTPNPTLALRVAWDAIVLFLTYPETTHPLAHRLHIPWLRPQSVRLTIAAVTLLTTATAVFTPEDAVKAAAPASKTPVPAEKTPAQQPFWFSPAGGIQPQGFEPIDRFGLAEDPPPVWTPPPVVSPPPATEPMPNKQSPTGPRLSVVAMALAVAPVLGLLLLYGMVAAVGMSVLPTYYRHFERPEPPAGTANPC